MPKEFIMRGKTVSGSTEVLNFSGYKPGYAYRLVDLEIYPAAGIGEAHFEGTASVTAAKTAMSPVEPNFSSEGLIGTCYFGINTSSGQAYQHSVINDMFLVTQNLILMVQDGTGASSEINWQCRFVSEKMSGPEEAATNYKQYLISDGS